MPDRSNRSSTWQIGGDTRRAVGFAIRGADKRFRRRLVALTLGIAALGVLDAVAVVLLGMATTWLLAAASGQPAPTSPIPLGPIDPAAWSQSPETVGFALAGIAIVLLLCRTALSLAGTRALVFAAYKHGMRFSVRLWRRVLLAPEAVLSTTNTNLLAYSVNFGATLGTAGVLTPAALLTADAFLVVVLGSLLLLISPVAGLISFAVFGGTAIAFARWIGPRADRAAQSAATEGVRVETVTRDGIHLYKESWAADRVDWLIDRYATGQESSNQAQRTVAFYNQLPRYVAEFVMVVSLACVAVAVALTSDGDNAAALFVAYAAAASRLLPAVVRIQSSLVAIRINTTQGAPTRDLVASVSEFGPSEADPIAPDASTIASLEGVTFSFSGRDEPVLKDVSLVVAPREFVAIVGPSGSGKSTLVNVLLGMLPPDAGSVSRKQVSPDGTGGIAYVPQDVWIMHGSIRENLTLGRSSITDEAIREMLGRTGLDGMLEESGWTLDTMLDERGNNLSGGQRQRMGLARALLTRPELLILDEATSGLDSRSEQAIVDEILGLKGQCAMVVIAHRLKTVTEADTVVYVDHGRILARGSFDEVRHEVPDFAVQAHLGGVAS